MQRINTDDNNMQDKEDVLIVKRCREQSTN